MIEVAKVDVVIVSGGDGGTNEFIVGKDINSFADIRGKALVTDAPNTAYALQAKKILLKHGLKDGVDYRINAVGAGPFRLKAMLEGGDNAAAIMNLPFSAQTIEAGTEEPRPHRRSARAVSGRRRVRAALLGQGERPECWRNISRATSSRCAGWSTRTTATRPSRC